MAIARGQRWGSTLGVLVAGGALAGYVISRTIGLPGLAPEIWISSPLAVLSLAVEAACIAVLVQSARSMRHANAQA
jgi:hypothetical protein